MARWIAMMVICLGACGGTRHVGSGTGTGAGAGTGTGTGTGTGVVTVKQTIVRWAPQNMAPPQAETPQNKIWLEVTDETGAAKSYPVDDEVDAPCTAEAGGEMEALGTLRCEVDGTGADYIAVARGSEIILLKKVVAPGEEDNDYEELNRITVPVGSKLAFSQ
jgi:hypothetical protein